MNTGKKGTIFGRKRVIGSIGFFMREDLRTSVEATLRRMRNSLTASLNRRPQLLPSLLNLKPYLVSPPLGATLPKQHSSNFVFIQRSHQPVSRHRVSR
ncbi:hypothetical protein WN944_023884 [Citrus x changshan-huyou]|uniref:Uncharacterized protein n=1 Tax=Citrus x changshan-huyou TaxID=2935761 RepID=A0AAP0LMV9_9ROSI